MKRAAFALCVLVAATAAAQQDEPPNAVLLVAKPALTDPNFRETVVLATQRPDGQTIGVILNRPTRLRAAELLPHTPGAERHPEPLYFGGPVLRRTVVALFRAARPPAASAFRMLEDVYLSMHPGNLGPLLARAGGRVRLYAGFSAWAPGQLQSEIARDGWHVLPASEDVIFRTDTAGMWHELHQKASGVRARREAIYFPS